VSDRSPSSAARMTPERMLCAKASACSAGAGQVRLLRCRVRSWLPVCAGAWREHGPAGVGKAETGVAGPAFGEHGRQAPVRSSGYSWFGGTVRVGVRCTIKALNIPIKAFIISICYAALT
jgi:hypothetical protein